MWEFIDAETSRKMTPEGHGWIYRMMGPMGFGYVFVPQPLPLGGQHFIASPLLSQGPAADTSNAPR
jgi:hypothetical protein